MQGVGGGSSSSGHAISKGFRDGGKMRITNIEEIPGAEGEDGEKAMGVGYYGNGVSGMKGKGG